MNDSTLIQAFSDYISSKNIDHPTMMRILQDVFRNMIKRKFGTDKNFDIIINVDKGDLEVLRFRTIVEDDAPNFDETDQLRLSEAHKIEPDFEVGEEVTESININKIFGRRIVQTAYQTLVQRIRDLETNSIYDKYKDMVGDLVVGEVYQDLSRELVILDDENNELILPKNNQIYKDNFRKGSILKAVVHKVDISNNNVKIVLSRTSPEFLKRLFESEIPEVEDGTIMIKKVVREPGDRAKVAVESYDERVDPVGACVGINGSRIRSVLREVCQENIDIIHYSDNLELLIKRTLAPALVNNVKIGSGKDKASVFLDKDQISLAIGKGGININLASRLTGIAIDLFRELTAQEKIEEEEDVELSEFLDVIDEWVVEEFKKIGLDTAKTVLAANPNDLAKRTDLEEETVNFVLEVLRKEFDQ